MAHLGIKPKTLKYKIKMEFFLIDGNPFIIDHYSDEIK